jgi:superfamily II DNA or RNA helicase
MHMGFDIEDWGWELPMAPMLDEVTEEPEKRGFTLRPYQQQAVTDVRLEMAKGVSRIILASPTGSGKTEMGFDIIRGAQAKRKKVAFLANRIHLVDQTCKRLDAAGFSYGVIQSSNTREPWRDILVCSIQTVAKRGLPDVDLIVMDECHSAAGTAAYRTVMKDKHVVGLSATPYSKGLGKHYDDLGGPLFERVVIAAKIKDLIRDDYLVSADIWAPSEPDLKGVRTTAGDYNEKDLGEAVDKPSLIGDIVSHWLRIAKDTPTVVFATNISHSQHIVEQFSLVGVKAEHIDCYTSDTDRSATLARVASGETMVISNVGILAEGWDFPACKTLILARPTKSLIRYLQMAGRVLRPFKDKPIATILDHAGVVRRLGFPWDDFSQELDDGNPKPVSEKKDAEEPLPKACPQCHFMKAPKTPLCPRCGFSTTKPNTVKNADGNLVPVTKGTKDKGPASKGVLTGMPRADFYQQLLYLANVRGYKDGWAAVKYKEVFGSWPNGISKTPMEASGVVLSWEHSQRIKWAKSRNRRQD